MKNYLIYYLLITLSIIVNSCSEGFKEEYSKFSLVLKEVTAITTPTTDTPHQIIPSVPPSHEPSLTVVHVLQVLPLQSLATIPSL
jgi:hypothetical protein